MAITEQGTKFLTSFQNIDNIEPNLELELRIKLSSQQRDFTIPDYLADYLRDLFVRNRLPCTTERTTVERYDRDIRKITNTDTGEVRYERKQRVNVVDMPAIRFTPVYSFDIRISLARETPIDYNENNGNGKVDPSQTRKRTRYMYSVNREDGVSIASYILTKIGETQPFYEFEIEFNVYEGDVRRHIIESYHQMMKLLYLDIF